MRILCVGRHHFIAEHFGRFFARFGFETSWVVGIGDALSAAWRHQPHLVVCDYELLTTQSLDIWERDSLMSRTPVIGVSLTRRPEDVNPLDVNGIGGFIYLPQLTEERARQLFSGVCPPAPYSPVGVGAGTAVAVGHLTLLSFQPGG